MPKKTLKPHDGPVINKPRPGETASMTAFVNPTVQRPTAMPVTNKQKTECKSTKAVRTDNQPKLPTITGIDHHKVNVVVEKPISAIEPAPVATNIPAPAAPVEPVTPAPESINTYEPIAKMGLDYAEHALKVGDTVAVKKNGVIIDTGTVALVCVNMYFVETKKQAPRFHFASELERLTDR